MQTCPDVQILATSREGLAVEGERVWPLRSLPIPGTQEPIESIAASDAVRLFVERAEMARPGFTLDATNAAAIADICRRLDGIPLAIELAAARVSAMRPADIAARVDERFRLLTGGRGTAVERHPGIGRIGHDRGTPVGCARLVRAEVSRAVAGDEADEQQSDGAFHAPRLCARG